MLKPFRGVQLNRTHPFARGLVACWLMNEGTGDQLFDLARGLGNGAGVQSWSPLGIDTSASDVSYADRGVWTEWTIMTKVRSNVAVSSTERRWINSTGNEYLGIWGHPNANFQQCWAIYDSTFVGWRLAKYTTTLQSDTDYILCGTAKNNDNVRAYLNGKLETTTALTTIQAASDGTGYIGSTGGSKYFDGDIAFTYIWDRQLSASEISQLYLNPYAMFPYGINPALLYAPPVVGGVPTLFYQTLLSR